MADEFTDMSKVPMTDSKLAKTETLAKQEERRSAFKMSDINSAEKEETAKIAKDLELSVRKY